MNWSESLIPTLRDDPQEAEIDSHKLMLRAGLIRRLGGGLYTFLPLGLRALHKVKEIIRQEMNTAGAQEILMPALQPREIWDKSGRYDSMADVMFRCRDHQDKEMVLGPTHEEVVTMLMASELRSYRQLPLNLYQIQTKFRDEIRPRFGLMRAKEFIMKDAYSFDADWDMADISYRKMYEAYKRIFLRCGLQTTIVEAETGAMGGKSSHEFMVPADSGEDGIVECSKCTYAANMERADRAQNKNKQNSDASSPIQYIDTPGAKTIDEVSALLDISPDKLIKTLIYTVDGDAIAILIPGDREANENKIARFFKGKAVELADENTIEKSTLAPVGFAGPVNLKIPVYCDMDIKGKKQMIVGGNKADTHISGVDIDRDVQVIGYADFCIAKEGDPCPNCGEPMKQKRGIEVGHVFKLGVKYSEQLGASFLEESGKEKPAIMGCYGIGVTRTLQAIIEQKHDKKGIIWPVSVAPYVISILLLNPDNSSIKKAASKIANELTDGGIDFIIDDRDERPGVKFNDSELLGFPVRMVISERSLAKQSIEISFRATGETELVPQEKACAMVENYCANYTETN